MCQLSLAIECTLQSPIAEILANIVIKFWGQPGNVCTRFSTIAGKQLEHNLIILAHLSTAVYKNRESNDRGVDFLYDCSCNDPNVAVLNNKYEKIRNESGSLVSVPFPDPMIILDDPIVPICTNQLIVQKNVDWHAKVSVPKTHLMALARRL